MMKNKNKLLICNNLRILRASKNRQGVQLRDLKLMKMTIIMMKKRRKRRRKEEIKIIKYHIII